MRLTLRWLCAAIALCLASAAGATSLELLELRRMLTVDEHAEWRGVGRVNIATFSERGMCTGTLIAEDLVLTAAHCVISARTGKLYEPGNIHFVAGWRMGSKVAESRASSIAIHPSYRPRRGGEGTRRGLDLALLRLRTPIPAEIAPPFAIGPPRLVRRPLTLISYRRDRAHALTRQDGCDLKRAQANLLLLGCDVTFGASGSPVFASENGQTRLVAVISAMSESRGQSFAWAVMVDRSVFAEVLARLD
ncbi:trypsin-like serine protease [Paralimibaculum aggregatum]|uniref:Trypsin-like serine protease n=1 Tax=Paralimibaculum aggregatum TaxID=3036245 RepID=A0ABQ6LJJ1_9RHOB|nr:trypsin-like serine protease [Limibaculum sp. NKW23]GMG80948.1 trypsin-like serine protease [Limibaculum sp. NKW23]